MKYFYLIAAIACIFNLLCSTQNQNIDGILGWFSAACFSASLTIKSFIEDEE